MNELDEFLFGCPDWIINKSVEYLNNNLSDDTKNQIRNAWNKNHNNWWVTEHFGWGMYIRNQLRDGVCKDDELPSGNWDDYYIQMVELVCGIR